MLDEQHDELLQITEHLYNYQDLDAVHIVSHGEVGQLSFAQATLNSDTLPEYVNLVEDWGNALSADADLVFYGCDIAQGELGDSFVQELNQLTRADVSASTDDTGIDGDWELEATVGEVETNPIFDAEVQDSYQHNLVDSSIAPVDLPDFSNTGLENTGFDFTTVPADDLTIFAEAGLNFNDVDPSTLSNIDFNQIPLEDFQILADAGLSLETLSPQEVSQINLNALSGLNYLSGIDFTAIESLNGDTTFAQLSDSVVANAHLFDYKTANLELDSGLSIEQLSQFNQSDFSAIDYAFAGDEAFDGNFYLAENPDVKNTGVNPFAHYIETGAAEGRDPNATFDSDFYLAENPDVKNAGANPFKHYLELGAAEGRYQNQVFKSFDRSDGVLVASANLSDEQFGTFKEQANSIGTTEGTEIAAVPLLLAPAVVGGIKVLIVTVASLTAINSANNIRQLIQDSDSQIYYTPVDDDLFADTNVERFPAGEGDAPTNTPPFDLGELGNAREIDPEKFPSGNKFLEDILGGQFEFPDAEEGGSYFLASESSGNIGLYTPQNAGTLLDSREDITLELFGGTTGQLPGAINVDIVAEQGIKADLLTDGLSFIPDNSVEEIVTFNPFIPKDAGGTGILDYLPEAARTLEPGGQIIINGTTNNKFTKVKQSLDLESLGLRVVQKQVPLLDRFSNLTFRRIDGSEIDKNLIKTTILEKI